MLFEEGKIYNKSLRAQYLVLHLYNSGIEEAQQLKEINYVK